MKKMIRSSILICCVCLLAAFTPKGETVTLVIPKSAHARILFGADKLTDALQKAGYQVCAHSVMPCSCKKT